MTNQRTFNRNLVSLKAFLPNDKHVENIIKMCNLSPTDDWKIWTDQNNNNIIAKKNKTIHVKNTDINNQILRDIYFKSHPKQIFNNSKVVMFIFIEQQDVDIPERSFVLFIGEDEKIRLSCYIKGEWSENKLPLAAGIQTLRTLIDHKNIESCAIYNGNKYAEIPNEGKVIKVWISKTPIQEDIILDMLMTNKILSDKILKDLGAI